MHKYKKFFCGREGVVLRWSACNEQLLEGCLYTNQRFAEISTEEGNGTSGIGGVGNGGKLGIVDGKGQG